MYVYIYIYTIHVLIWSQIWALAVPMPDPIWAPMRAQSWNSMGPILDQVHLAPAGSSALPSMAANSSWPHGEHGKTVLARRAWGGRGRRAHVSIRSLKIMHALFRRRGGRPYAKTHTYPNGRAHLAWEFMEQNVFPICGAHARQHSGGNNQSAVRLSSEVPVVRMEFLTVCLSKGVAVERIDRDVWPLRNK
jgi:hypothetical protein